MFGVYRTVLALVVAAAHLGGLPTGGHFAVFGFFILSGYLMTLILHRTYGYSVMGRFKYLLNRVLRIYPPYWTAMILSALLAGWLGRNTVAPFHPVIFVPETWKGALQNFFLLLTYQSEPRLVAPAWALTIELFFYLCIGLGASRTRFGTVVWFALSAIYTVVINVRHVSFDVKYYFIPAASLPFSTGAMIYHFRESLLQRMPILARDSAPFILFGLCLADAALTFHRRAAFSWGFYAAYAFNALLVLSLLDRKSLPGISKSTDSIVGDFSYPIYLVHYQAGLILVAAGLGATRRGEPLFFLATLPVMLLLAWAMTRFVEWPVEAIRKRVKAKRRAEEYIPSPASS